MVFEIKLKNSVFRPLKAPLSFTFGRAYLIYYTTTAFARALSLSVCNISHNKYDISKHSVR